MNRFDQAEWSTEEEWIAFLRTKQMHICPSCRQTCRDSEWCTCPDGEARMLAFDAPIKGEAR